MKKPVPLYFVCPECVRYKTCTKLCKYAEAYANQDRVSQHDALFSEMGMIDSTIREDFTAMVTSNRYKGRGRPIKKGA